MNKVQLLKRKIEKKFPEAKVGLDEPFTTKGTWWLSISYKKKVIDVEWRSWQGFVVTDVSNDAFPTVEDELLAPLHTDIASAFRAVENFLER